MGATHLGPELADAASHTIGIVVEFCFVLQRDEVRGAGLAETTQVQLLPAGDDGKYVADAPLVVGTELCKFRQQLFNALQQGSFCRPTLVLDQFAEMDRGLRVAQNLRAQVLQRAKSSLDRNNFGISDRVAGAREQIGQPDLRPNWVRQHAQREVERARHVLEESREQGPRWCSNGSRHGRAWIHSPLARICVSTLFSNAPVAAALLWCRAHR